MKKTFITIASLFFMLSACTNGSASSRGESGNSEVAAEPEAVDATQTTEDRFIDFSVVQDEGNPLGSVVKFSDYVGNGKYVLVDFWASWCDPCKREIPYIKAVYEKYKGDDFDVLSVAVWDKPEDTEAAAKAHGVVWDQIVNAQDIPTKIYGIEGIPYLMLIGPEGEILYRNCRGPQIEEVVSKYLGR